MTIATARLHAFSDHDEPARTRARARTTAVVATLALALGALWADAAAAGAPSSARSALIETGSVQPPKAFADLCARRPETCPERSARPDLVALESAFARLYGAAGLAPEPPELTDARWRQIVQVNATVNGAIQPVADTGADDWQLGALSGDCEEYVLMKRELLARMGWPRSALRITVVRDGQGYHAVLVVSTDQGEFVLDNMVADVGRVEDSPYEFVVSESAATPGEWVRVQRAL